MTEEKPMTEEEIKKAFLEHEDEPHPKFVDEEFGEVEWNETEED